MQDLAEVTKSQLATKAEKVKGALAIAKVVFGSNRLSAHLHT